MSESVVKWISGMVPPSEGYYFVTTKNKAGSRDVAQAWWDDEEKQWETDVHEFKLVDFGVVVIAYAELPKPWSGETE